MKQRFFEILTAGVLIITALGACTKEYVSQVSSTKPRSTSTPFNIELVADQWMSYGDGVYGNDFPNVLSNLSMEARSHLNVYLRDYDGISLTQAPIIFEDHEMWITMTPTDLILNYRYHYPPLPFKSLNVQVVVN